MIGRTFVAALLVPHLVCAQAPGAAPSSVGITLARLDAISRIMVSDPSVGRASGRFHVEGDRLVLILDGAERTFGLASIDSVWVRSNNWKVGAAVGGLALAPLGALYGGLVGGIEGGELTDFDAGGAILGGLVGAAVGAGVGAALGSAFPRWNLRYP